VNLLPDRMADRWKSRPEPGPGQAQVYWHILMRDQPQVCALAALARHRLADFAGLHFTPEERLHLSVLRVGLSEDMPPGSLDAMVSQVRENLRQVPPATITFRRVGYHPEAIVLLGEADQALSAVSAAIRSAPGLSPGETAGLWLPHVTVAYSTAEQPAGPIIAALGSELPTCRITVDTVSLIAQRGPERLWDWQPMARLRLTAQPAPAPGGGAVR
jgi:2'-5' RNA ligase